MKELLNILFGSRQAKDYRFSFDVLTVLRTVRATLDFTEYSKRKKY